MNALAPNTLMYGAAIVGAYFLLKQKEHCGNSSNATRETMHKRRKYGGRKGRRAAIRLFGPAKKKFRLERFVGVR